MIFRIAIEQDKWVEKIYKKSIKELNEFFELEWTVNMPKIFIVPDRKTIDQLWGKKTKDWQVGKADRGSVYILDKNNFEKESCHIYSDKKYAQLIKHELAHLFLRGYSSHQYAPTWLREGLSCYLAGQNKTTKRPQKLKEFLKYYNSNSHYLYSEAGFAIEYIIKKYGKDKFLKLLKSMNKISSKGTFDKKFKEIYGFAPAYKYFQDSNRK